MSNGTAVAAAAARARKTPGSLVRPDTVNSAAVRSGSAKPPVVMARGWMFGTPRQYPANHEGLTLATPSRTESTLPNDTEIAEAASV